MSADGMSHRGAKANLAGTHQPILGAELFSRRSVAGEGAGPAPAQRRSRPRDGVAGEPRRLLRCIPSAGATQAFLDLVLVGLTGSAVIGVIYHRLGLGGSLEVAAITALSVTVFTLLLYATGCYRRDSLLSRSAAISRIPTALSIAAALIFLCLHYAFPLVFPATRVFASISLCATVTLVAAGVCLASALASRTIIHILLAQDFFCRRILVIGTGRRARHIEELNRAQGSPHELHFVGEIVLASLGASHGPSSIPSIGEMADKLQADEIVVALDGGNGAPLDGLLACKARGIPVTEFHAFVERQTGAIEMAWLELNWLVHAPGFQFRLIDQVVKRAMDIAFSLIALVISLPVLLAAMAAVRLDSPGPIFYRQERVTKGGRVFWLYKLRSMRVDAEQGTARFADKNDSRVTRVGRFLRQTRLDEIPQLVNILKGDMAIVGPRPERPVFVDQLSSQLRLYDLRHTVRAGLTGWAQINYRYGASFEDSERKLEYDLYYIKNFSLLRDLGIMLQTLRVILWPEGVH